MKNAFNNLSIFSKFCLNLQNFMLLNLLWKLDLQKLTLHEKCSYSEFFWFVFSRIWTEHGEKRSISPSAVRMQENTDQINYEYGHLLRSVTFLKCFEITIIMKQWRSCGTSRGGYDFQIFSNSYFLQ